MDIAAIADYSTSAQTRLYDFLLNEPGACLAPAETIGSYKTINDLLAHLSGAELRWQARILGRDQPARYEDNPPADVARLYADWKTFRETTLSIIRNASQDELARSLKIQRMSDLPEFVLTVEQILFHVFNHENFHRGQISMLLQQRQIDPPYFDFIFEFMRR